MNVYAGAVIGTVAEAGVSAAARRVRPQRIRIGGVLRRLADGCYRLSDRFEETGFRLDEHARRDPRLNEAGRIISDVADAWF